MPAICAAAAAYLIGSVPSAFIVGKFRGVDLRKEGSGNIGATNALRVLGKKWGYLVFAADLLKGWLAVWAGYMIAWRYCPGFEVVLGVIGAVFAVLGHNYPVWLGFKGGKGIATSGGVMIALFPIWVFVTSLAFWGVLFYTTRYVSVASIGGAMMLPASAAVLAAFGMCDWRLVPVAGLMCALAVWRHRENIRRLLEKKEKKFQRKPPANP